MKKTVFTDFLKGIIGLVFMNAMLSLLVYPFLGRELGIALQGKILFYTSLMGWLAGTFGSAANYGRLKLKSMGKESRNGEYNLFLTIGAAIIFLFTILIGFWKGDFAETSPFFLVLLIILTTIRYYADVEFRISLNYTRFMIYYLVIGVGYGVGMALFPLTHSWILIFLIGEVCGLFYVLLTGRIFRGKILEKTTHTKENFTLLFSLGFSYFLSDFVGAADRLLFPLLLADADTLTSLYYYASVVGKIASLLSTPLNGVLAGHLAVEEKKPDRKGFCRIILLIFGAAAVLAAIATVGSHLFVRLFYPDYYETVKPLFLLANAGQVLFFASNTLMVVVLRFTDVKNQIITGLCYIIVFFAVTVPLILNFGLWGMAWGIFLVNAIRFLSFTVFAFVRWKK